jgi:hypothetical protein
MYNHSLGRFNTNDPYSQFNSPYLAMANNPISFVDPDGGKANHSAYVLGRTKERIYRHLVLDKKELSKRDALALWLELAVLNGNPSKGWRGMTLEGLRAAVREFGADGYRMYLNS